MCYCDCDCKSHCGKCANSLIMMKTVKWQIFVVSLIFWLTSWYMFLLQYCKIFLSYYLYLSIQLEENTGKCYSILTRIAKKKQLTMMNNPQKIEFLTIFVLKKLQANSLLSLSLVILNAFFYFQNLPQLIYPCKSWWNKTKIFLKLGCATIITFYM